MAKAKKATTSAPSTSSSPLRIAGAVLFGGALLALPFLQANEAIDWAVVQLIGTGNPYQTPVIPKPAWNGYTAKNVTLLSDGQPVTIGEIRFEASPFWVWANTYTFRRFRPYLSEVLITYSDVQNPDGYWLTTEELPIGPRSAAFAELEGCGSAWRMSDSQMRELNLTPGQTTITYHIEIEGSKVTTTQTLHTPGLGEAKFTRIGLGSQPSKKLFERHGLPGDIQWKTHQWTLKDEGFIKARNEFCARETGVSIETFLANHIASIERNMAALGITMSPEMRAMYIDYAANGGALSLSGDFDPEIEEARYYDLSWNEQLLSLRGEMQRDQTRIAARFLNRSVLPFTENDGDLTTYEVLVKEGYRADPLSLPQPGAYAANVQKTAEAGEGESGEGQASETMVVSVNVAPELTSEVIKIPALEPDYLSFEGLASVVGRRVRVERVGKPTLEATVLPSSGTTVRLRFRQASGFAEIELEKKDFARAMLYPKRAR